VEHCKRGPAYSTVTSVDVQRDAVGDKLVDFAIRR